MFKTILLLFFTFFKIGIFTIGGGYAMLPLLHKETVENQKWITEEEFTEYVALAEITPGPIMINLATFVGYKKAGVPGVFASVIGTVIFPVIAILMLTAFLMKYRDLPQVKGSLFIIKPLAIGLITTAVLKLGNVTFNNIKSIIIAVLTIILVYFLKVNPIFVILAAIAIGVFLHPYIL